MNLKQKNTSKKLKTGSDNSEVIIAKLKLTKEEKEKELERAKDEYSICIEETRRLIEDAFHGQNPQQLSKQLFRKTLDLRQERETLRKVKAKVTLERQESLSEFDKKIEEVENRILRPVDRTPDCPVCFDKCTPERKIYQCSQGHILCGRCLNQLITPRTCPVCRLPEEDMLPGFVRNLMLEQLFVTNENTFQSISDLKKAIAEAEIEIERLKLEKSTLEESSPPLPPDDEQLMTDEINRLEEELDRIDNLVKKQEDCEIKFDIAKKKLESGISRLTSQIEQLSRQSLEDSAAANTS